MTTRSRPLQRTPRRKKLFIQYEKTHVLGAGLAGTPQIDDMLDQGFTDLGLSNMFGLTVMDVRGSIRLIRWIAGATSAQHEDIRMGYNWFDPLQASASDGDAQIPRPLQLGTRDTKWIQQWQVDGTEQTSADVQVGVAIAGDTAMIDGIHVRNMRKQPSANSKLCMVYFGGSGWETNTTAVKVSLLIMLALP